MSLPSFPDTEQALTREQVINQIISSIAMEELGLSHIINAEGEKLQYALGTIPGVTGPEESLTVDDLLKLNDSIHKTLDGTMMNQHFLKAKLVSALSASVMQGPTGPRGEQGPATISIDPIVDELSPDESPYVNNDGTTQDVILKFGIPRGATGAAPTITVANTQTIEPGLNANVTTTPTATGVELNFSIPRGVTGTISASGMQAVFNNNTGTEIDVLEGDPIIFSDVILDADSDISYDGAGIFTVTNNDAQNNIYSISWSVLIDGLGVQNSGSLALDVGGTLYLSPIPWANMQITGSTLATANDDEFTISIINNSIGPLTLPDVNVVAQISILRFNRLS